MAPDPSAKGLFQFLHSKKDTDVTPKTPIPAHTVLLVRHPAGHSKSAIITTGRPVEYIAQAGKFTVVRVDDPKLNDYNLWNVEGVTVYPENGPVKSVSCAEGTYLEIMVQLGKANIGTKIHEMVEDVQTGKSDLPGPLASYGVKDGKVVPIQVNEAQWGVIPNGKTQSMFEMVQAYKEKYFDLGHSYSIENESAAFPGKPEEVGTAWVKIGTADNVKFDWVSSDTEKVIINPAALDPWVVYDPEKDVYYVNGQVYRFKHVAVELMYYVRKSPTGPWLSLANTPLEYLNKIAREERYKLEVQKSLTDYTTKPVITRVKAINGFLITMYENNKYYEATIVNQGDVEGLTAEFPNIFRKRVQNVIRHQFGINFDEPEQFWFNHQADYVKAIEKEFKYPGKESSYAGSMMPLRQIIITLNDYEMWSREAIADWLDTLDEQPVFYPKAQEPTRRLVNTARVVTLEPHLQKEDPKSGQ